MVAEALEVGAVSVADADVVAVGAGVVSVGVADADSLGGLGRRRGGGALVRRECGRRRKQRQRGYCCRCGRKGHGTAAS